MSKAGVVGIVEMSSNSSDDLLTRVKMIRVDSRHGRRSPHKPLLLLLSIGRHLNGHERLATFDDIERDLNRLIRRFGLPDSRENAYHPFWHLRNDGLWQIDRPDLVRMTTAGHAYISDLREHSIMGGLAEDVLSVLDTNPDLTWRVVQSLLNDYFPPSLHEDVLRDVGLVDGVAMGEQTDTTSSVGGRDRSFREVVLRAYERRCAVCELDVRIYGQSIGLEAAHIKWHSQRGPDQLSNGIALCVLHHKFFDSGLFTVLPDLTILLGGLAIGHGVEESLNRYGGSALQVIPDHPDQRPAAEYLEWHKRAVFHSRTVAQEDRLSRQERIDG